MKDYIKKWLPTGLIPTNIHHDRQLYIATCLEETGNFMIETNCDNSELLNYICEISTTATKPVNVHLQCELFVKGRTEFDSKFEIFKSLFPNAVSESELKEIFKDLMVKYN
jgi:hypothetical protein